MKRCEFTPTGRPAPAHFGPEAIEYRCVRPRCGNRAYTAQRAEQIYAACRDPHWLGLGDLAAWLARLLGIRGSSRCGCAHRRAWLNRLAGIRLKW
jgi:hypothetical protein